MAKKNREHKKIVENETGSDSDSDSEPKPTQTQSTKKPASSTPAATKKPAPKPQQPSFSSSESESDSEPKPKDSPKSRKSTKGAKKTSVAADPVSLTRSAAQKRPAEDEEGADAKPSKKAKKKKKKAEPETEKKPTETPKKAFIPRFWSEDDDLVILQGMIDYKNKKKADPFADLDAFSQFIKKNLSTKDFDKTQLLNKIRRQKKKYKANKMKEVNMEKEGKEMTLSKHHEQKCFELSKSMWGNKNDANKRRTVVAEKEDAAAKEGKALERVIRKGETVEERVLRIGTDKFENGKGDSSAEKEWKKLRLEEMEAKLKLLEVDSARARLVVESFLSEDS